MRVGRVVIGLVVVLAAVAAAIVIGAARGPTEQSGRSPGTELPSPCPSDAPALKSSVWGLDVNKNQHTNAVGGATSWSMVARSEHPPEFAYLKASEGGRDPAEVNPWLQRDVRDATAVGVTVGFVHWAVPGEPTDLSVEQDALAEARAAVRAMGRSQHGTMPPALALGLNPRRLSPEDITAWALSWLAEVERLVGRPPVLFASSHFLTRSINAAPELTAYPLWLDGNGCVPAPWSDWTFRTADSAGLPRFGFAIAPRALVFAYGSSELTKLARS